MEEPLGYNVLNATKGLWLTDEGDWDRSYRNACKFDSLEEANDRMQENDKCSTFTFYVLACMPSP